MRKHNKHNPFNMKKLSIFLAALAVGMAAYAQNAQELAFVTKNNVNMRATPSTQGKIVGKAKEGMVFYAEAANNGWRLVKSPTGEKAYISATMLDNLRPEELKVYKATDILKTQQEADDEMTAGYTVTKQGKNWEQEETWVFIGDKTGKSNKVKATYTTKYANTTGLARANETNYVGTVNGWYILLTGTIDYNDNVEKCETPIVVYPAFSANSGVFVDGNYFPDMSDTSNWGD